MGERVWVRGRTGIEHIRRETMPEHGLYTFARNLMMAGITVSYCGRELTGLARLARDEEPSRPCGSCLIAYHADDEAD